MNYSENYSKFLDYGNSLLKEEKYEEAIIYYDKAIELNPELPEAWRNKGNALVYLWQLENAIISYDIAISFDSHDLDSWYNKGWALMALKQYKNAVISFDEALQLAVDGTTRIKLLGHKRNALMILGDLRGSIKCTNQITETRWYLENVAA